MRFLIINGPNMNLLGSREPAVYGRQSYDELVGFLHGVCTDAEIDCEFFQSNHEGAIIDEIQRADSLFDAIVINPAAYSHYSIAIADALRAISIPAAEVHLTDITHREEYRRVSVTGEACAFTVVGKGFDGYAEAIIRLKEMLCKE